MFVVWSRLGSELGSRGEIRARDLSNEQFSATTERKLCIEEGDSMKPESMYNMVRLGRREFRVDETSRVVNGSGHRMVK